MIPLGCHAYVGAPGAGKTWRAKTDALELAQKHNCGVVVVDTVRSPTLADIPRANTRKELLPCWTGSAARAYTPRDVAEFDEVIELCSSAGNVVVIVDEIFTWRRSKKLIFLCRTWRASRCTVLMTTQHISGDVGQDLLAAEPMLYIFRTTAPTSLEFLEKWKDIDPEEVKDLPDREFFEVL